MILPSAAAVTDRPEGEVQGMEQGEIEVVPSLVLIADSPEGGREGGEMETVPKVVTVTLTGVGEGMEGEIIPAVIINNLSESVERGREIIPAVVTDSSAGRGERGDRREGEIMPAVLLNSSAECGEGQEMSEGGEMSERGNGVEVETISAVVTDSSAGRGEGGEGEMLPAVDVDRPVGGEEGTVSVQPPVVVRGHSTEDVQLDVREIDVKEEDRVKQFLINGCECSMKCTSNFTQQHFQLMRSNAMELNRTELDMTVMGQVMAFTHCRKATINSTKHRHQIKMREKNTTTYHHQGVKVCRKTFLFLHNIGEFRLKAIKAQYLAEGLVPRIHGHSGRIAPNALVLEHVQSIVTFVMQYAETNGILLPGRIPGYKRDDIQLLPSSTTKRAVWLLFQECTTSLSARPVSYSTFCRVWRNFLGHVVVCKPMSDLCATCQRNSTAIVRSVNMGEEDKSEVLSTHIEHMQSTVHIHMHACTMFSHTPTVDCTCTYMYVHVYTYCWS